MNATTTDTTPKTSPKTRDLLARTPVYTKDRTTVLVKFFAMPEIMGLPIVQRQEKAIDATHEAEAKQRGLNAQAYRQKPDTGHCRYQKETDVSVRGLLAQFTDLGLRFIGGHSHDQPGKGLVTTLTFSTEGEAKELPAHVAEMLETLVWNHATVWCNLKYNNPFDHSEGQFRLDTVNLAAGSKNDRPYRILKIKGNSYELV